MKIEQIWPEWKVEKAIGQGSYGTVYKCVCNENGEQKYSAIKVISVPQIDAEYGVSTSDGLTNAKEDYKEIVDEFAKEIKILESLKGNKNIVSIEDSKVIEKEDGIGWQIFIRMELLTDFNTYTSQKKLEREDIFKLGTDLCEALKVCASQKIIHRDIKPENIFVDSEGNFKLGDFGVAKQLEKTEASLSRKGTYNYMAPEVFNSKKYDSRADIYSLGIVMYKLFNNNRLPFIDPTKQIVKYSEREEAFEKRIRGEKIPAINNVDENTNNLLLRACAYKADERFRTVEEFENAIKDISEGKKIRKSLRQFITSPKGASIISVVLVLSILGGTLAYTFRNKNKSVDFLGADNLSVEEETSVAEESTSVTEKKVKIEYSGMCDGIYTFDGVDYCAGYEGNFYAVSATKKEKLSDQRVTTEFTIINDSIYYSVIEGSTKNNIDLNWYKCSCWVMDLDGSNKKKLFDYNGSGCVVYADEKNIYYSFLPDEPMYDDFCVTLNCYNKITKETKEISDVDCILYQDGYILFTDFKETAANWEDEFFRYNINSNSLEKLGKGTVEGVYDNNIIVSQYKNDDLIIKKYNVAKNAFETLNVNLEEYYLDSVSNDALIFNKIINGTNLYYCYKNGKLAEIKDAKGAHFVCVSDDRTIYTETLNIDYNNYTYFKATVVDNKGKKRVFIDHFSYDTDARFAAGENMIAVYPDINGNLHEKLQYIAISDFKETKDLKIELVDFYGWQISIVMDVLDFIGLKAKITEEYSLYFDEGEVIAQSPYEGQIVKYGSEIELTVSKGSEDGEITFNYMPKLGGKHNIKVYFAAHLVEDKNDVVLNGGDYIVKIPTKVVDDKIYFLIDDDLVSTNNFVRLLIDDNIYLSGSYDIQSEGGGRVSGGMYDWSYYSLDDGTVIAGVNSDKMYPY